MRRWATIALIVLAIAIACFAIGWTVATQGWFAITIAALIGLGCGFVIARLGIWVRMAMIEDRFRRLALELHEYQVMSGDDRFDAGWVLDTVDYAIHETFAGDSVVWEFHPFARSTADVYADDHRP